MTVVSEKSGCYSWSSIFESSYDSAASRWLAFGAINRLSQRDMVDLWRGQLDGARSFYLEKMVPRRSLWPVWLDELFAPGMLRFCPKCARVGYHSIFHQVPTIEECPWHAVRLTDACLSCGCARAIWVDRYRPRARCIRCRAEPYPELPSRMERSSQFLAEEIKAFHPQATALARLRDISVRIVMPTADYPRSTKRPSASEVICALAVAHRLPKSSVLAMNLGGRPVVDAIVEPLVRSARGRCIDGRRSVWPRIQMLAGLPGCLPANVSSLQERPYSLEAGFRLEQLMQPVSDGASSFVIPPFSDGYWTLVLRALASDWDYGRMGISQFVLLSLRHRLLIRFREREPEWLVFRAVRQ